MTDQELIDGAARELITGSAPGGLERTLFVEAGAGSGKTRSLVNRVVALVDNGVELRHIAAITFTEKAAAELRERIRAALETRRASDTADAARWETALAQLDGAAISTLHAFAQRLLSEWPLEAGLPPQFDVTDELSARIAFDERWETFRSQLLSEDDYADDLRTLFACRVKVDDHLGEVARELDRNWDQLEEPGRFVDMPRRPLDVTSWCEDLGALAPLVDACTDPDDRLAVRLREISKYRDELLAADELRQIELLRAQKPSFRAGRLGRKGNWSEPVDAVRARLETLNEARKQLLADHITGAVERVVGRLARFVLANVETRRAAGQLTFHDLLVFARRLLRGPDGAQVRQDAGSRYQRLLLDEFQDTDPIQIELATLLSMKDPAVEPGRWEDIETQPGSLFFVGDPKQSIYRFRRADVGLFLDARTHFGDGEPVTLSTNFRTVPGVLSWVNQVFGSLIVANEGSQPAYEALHESPDRTDPPSGPAVAVLGAEPHEDEPKADALRRREAADVGDTVLQALDEGWSVHDDTEKTWRPARPRDITILIPTRTSFGDLSDALTARGIPFKAEQSALVYHTDEVRDLHIALRVIADPTDEVAMVNTLRSPLFACGDDELLSYRNGGGAWNLATPVDPSAADHPVGRAIAALQGLHAAHRWLPPAELMDTILRDRRMFELGYAGSRPRDVWRRLRFVVDQARAWSEATGGTLVAYLAWAEQQADELAKVSEPILDETDDDAVAIMTIHAAKGLEFPITILSGMSSSIQRGRPGPMVLMPAEGPAQVRLVSDARTASFEAKKVSEQGLEDDERRRLLYVAATRAKDHLVVSLHRGGSGETLAGWLSEAGATSAPALVPSPSRSRWPEPPPQPGAPPAEPTVEAFTAAHDRILTVADQRRAISATAVAQMAHDDAAAPEFVAGLQKDPADVPAGEEPLGMERAGTAHAQGRYGTKVGRAVHGTLQVVDLDDSVGLDEIAAAQAAVEGVGDQHADVVSLVKAALASPCVTESSGLPRWREIYVGAPVGRGSVPPGTASGVMESEPLVLEGYIDLLYRTALGLVVVDYKTASSAQDLDERTARYRMQGAAYALAVQEVTGEPVSRVVFCYLTPDGAAHEREITDIDAAVSEASDVIHRLVAS